MGVAIEADAFVAYLDGTSMRGREARRRIGEHGEAEGEGDFERERRRRVGEKAETGDGERVRAGEGEAVLRSLERLRIVVPCPEAPG